MSNLIRYTRQAVPEVVENEWQVFRADGGDASLPQGKVIVPFAWWLENGAKADNLARARQGQLSVWLAPADDVSAHADEILAGAELWPLIAVDFPVFKDGRGYSTAALLRRLGWQGELRAIGDVLVDQVVALARVGFDAFALRADQNTASALAQFSVFSVSFQDDWRGRRSQIADQVQGEAPEAPLSAMRAAQLWQIPAGDIPAEKLAEKIAVLQQRLRAIASEHKNVKFATSLAAEDMVLTDAIVSSGVKISLFTLDTGRLHAATVDMIAAVEKHYGISIARFRPLDSAVDAYIAEYGLNGFYESEQARQRCCQVRKVAPLNAALADADAWLSGQRREQSVTRHDLPLSERDEARGITKYNPLFDWSETEVWAYLKQKNVPIHPLHRRGYPSIGCEPCTRAVRQGEDIRAGRWWWLLKESKECGLHKK